MSAERPETVTSCADVRAAIRAGSVTPAARAHAETCPACAVLLSDDARLGRFLVDPVDGDPVGGDLADAVLARIARERNPVPRLGSGLRAALVWLAVLVPALGMLGWKPRPDLASYPIDRMILVLGALLVAGAVAARTSLRPLHRPLSSLRGVQVALGLLLPIAVALLPEIDNGFHPPWASATLHCFERGAALAGIVLAGLWLSDRRTRPGIGWWAGASALAAISGGLMLQIACPTTDIGHLVVGHGSIGLVLAMLAAIGLGVRRALGT